MTPRSDLQSDTKRTRGRKQARAHQPLTDRERTILQLIAAGFSNREIAEQLTLSPTTVKWYIKQIFNKLGAHRRTQAVKMATDLGLMAIAPPEFNPSPSIPTPVTALIGREKEVHQVINLLDDPTVSLLTILGPGGIGKTRLALEVANQKSRQMPGQVCFAVLDSVFSLSGLVQAVASAIGFRFHGPLDLGQQLLIGLRKRKLLLVMDSVEHLPEATRFVNEMLMAAPRLKILVTSRERLNLSSEMVFTLRGLDYPTSTTHYQDYASLILFMKVARFSQPALQLTTNDIMHVCRICQLVEGMPLAIELAAAWIDMLAPVQIAEEIVNGIGILETTLQDLPERHRSIRAVFERSWQLLSNDEREAFKKLSVFRGGFDRTAAEQVAGATLFMLSTLVDKSLLTRVGMDRFKLHELVRQFAQEKLQADAGEYTVVLNEHCRYYANLMKRCEDTAIKTDMSAIPGRLLSVLNDFDNILAAWHHGLDTPLIAEIGKYVFTISLSFAAIHLNSEADQTFAQALRVFDARNSPADAPDRLRVMTHYGWFLMVLYQFKQARQVLENALEFIPMSEHSHAGDVGLLLSFLGLALYLDGQPSAGREREQEALATCQAANFPFGVWQSLLILGDIERGESHYETAYHYYQQALMYSEQRKDLFGIPFSLGLLGWVCGILGRMNDSLDYLRRGLMLNHELLIADPLYFMVLGIAELYEQRGQSDVALELLAILLHNPQYGYGHPSTGYMVHVLLAQLQFKLSAEYVDTVLEKAKHGQLSSHYLDPHFTVTPELVERLLELLEQAANV